MVFKLHILVAHPYSILKTLTRHMCITTLEMFVHTNSTKEVLLHVTR